MKRKGVSPLVAVVMLIAFTLLVAGILGAMVTQFSQQQRASIQYCTGAKALILSGVQKADQTLILSIHNFGDVDLTFTVLQTHKNGTVSKLKSGYTVPATDIGQLELPEINLTTSDGFTIQSEECSGAQDLIRAEKVKSIS